MHLSLRSGAVRSVRSLLRPQAPAIPLRGFSTFAERAHRELTSRPIPWSFDYLHPQPSYLLNRSLVDLLDTSSHPFASLPSVNDAASLPAGHHLVYFPPQVTLSQLLPDGTDTLHTPGDPFNRRLWGGGRVAFSPSGGLVLDGSRAVCMETIRDVVVKGREGEEKVIVRIERRIGTVYEDEQESSIIDRLWRADEAEFGQSSVIENRDLVFMREKTREQLSHDRANFDKDRRTIKPPVDAEFRHTITPSKALLFRFSALTFNAHLIHLDPGYTRQVEGYRNLLVHGPLTLTLLLTTLQSRLLQSDQSIRDIQYRNLTPLYVDEPLTICGKQKPGRDGAIWDVWIEGSNGGLAVRGTAEAYKL
ncbi:hypothetical protein BDV59DRAFT_184433 [Aspergillus ambiguus]|uniref:uncharacterized protein n=1 Tax=Aspergillus ambiguus TaxID=176160 RepID=UPI003CCC9560